ncbi:MAG: magnesium transporter [Chloroflexi bacterium]|nr:MAG: magnesium transporter [Chloroflexota bacterium]MBA4375485.1 magnesium transporter [Anaerolinea sp.]
MITVYKGNEGAGILEVNKPADGCWVNVVDPTSDEIDTVRDLGIPADFITYPLDLDERPRTEKEDDGTTLILIKIPFFQGDKLDVPYTSIPLGIIITENMVITVCKRNNIILEELLRTKIKGFSTSKRIRFVLRILLLSATKFLSYLREINNIVETIEDKLQASMRNNEVLELLKYQKSLVYFETALKSNELMMERLQKTPLFHKFPEDEDLLEDVLTENQQAIEMIAIAENILSSMMDAFASIISNNLNVVMKFLASVTIVLSIPTIITSYFGMNVSIPFADHPLSYFGIILLFVVICAFVIAIFIRKDWF